MFYSAAGVGGCIELRSATLRWVSRLMPGCRNSFEAGRRSEATVRRCVRNVALVESWEFP